MPPAPADHIDFQQIADLAHAGDARAIQAIEEAGRAIGTGLCSLFALVDAFPIALIGRGTLVFDIMEGAIREALESTVGGGNINDIDIHCFADEKPLVAEGCAITALLVLDEEIADAAVV